MICARSDLYLGGMISHPQVHEHRGPVHRGCIMDNWSSTQRAIAQSAGSTGVRNHSGALRGERPHALWANLGESLRIRAYVSAQATVGLSHHAGLGKTWHIETAEL